MTPDYRGHPYPKGPLMCIQQKNSFNLFIPTRKDSYSPALPSSAGRGAPRHPSRLSLPRRSRNRGRWVPSLPKRVGPHPCLSPRAPILRTNGHWSRRQTRDVPYPRTHPPTPGGTRPEEEGRHPRKGRVWGRGPSPANTGRQRLNRITPSRPTRLTRSPVAHPVLAGSEG